jgi:hypothetical protein
MHPNLAWQETKMASQISWIFILANILLVLVQVLGG